MTGEIFDQKHGLNKQEEKDFLKQGSVEKIKEEVKGDLNKLERSVIMNYHSENYDNVSNARVDQIKQIVGKDFYDKNLKIKSGGSEGIAALQILAIKCVEKLNGKSVEDILESQYINSWAVDGILGPNTLFTLKEISKTELGGAAISEWNGVIDDQLLNKMINICGTQNNEIQNNEIQNNETQNNEIQNNETQNNETQNNEIQNNEIQNNETQNNEIQNNETNGAVRSPLGNEINQVQNNETQNNETQNNETQNNETQNNEIQNNEIQNNETQNNEAQNNEVKTVLTTPIENNEEEDEKTEILKPEFTLENLKNGITNEDGIKTHSGLDEITFKKYGLTYEMIFNSINTIKNEEIKDKISEFLLKGDVKGAQKYVGMKEKSKYDDNNADGKFDMRTLNRLTNPMFGLVGNEFLNYSGIPNDVREIYREFMEKNLNEGKTFSIVSKSNFNMYVFAADWSLISVHDVGLGQVKGDKKNEAYKGDKYATTPGGMYSVDNRIIDKNPEGGLYAGPGDYVALLPLDGQYDIKNPKNFTLGFHTYFQKYEGDTKRRNALENESNTNRRMSDGCINTLIEGSIYDNLILGSKVYVTFESN